MRKWNVATKPRWVECNKLESMDGRVDLTYVTKWINIVSTHRTYAYL